jgi:hypothetical protein
MDNNWVFIIKRIINEYLLDKFLQIFQKIPVRTALGLVDRKGWF